MISGLSIATYSDRERFNTFPMYQITIATIATKYTIPPITAPASPSPPNSPITKAATIIPTIYNIVGTINLTNCHSVTFHALPKLGNTLPKKYVAVVSLSLLAFIMFSIRAYASGTSISIAAIESNEDNAEVPIKLPNTSVTIFSVIVFPAIALVAKSTNPPTDPSNGAAVINPITIKTTRYNRFIPTNLPHLPAIASLALALISFAFGII